MYSTGNYTQYPTINTMEKNMKKRMYTCVQLSHFAVEQRLAQHCKSTILELKKKLSRDFPGGPVVKTVLPMQGPQVQPLVRAMEPICHN